MPAVPARIVAPLAGLALVALAGCGSASKPLSKPAYVSQANAICRTSQAAADKIAHPSQPTAAALRTFVTQSANALADRTDKLEKLVGPRIDRDQLDAMYAQERSYIATLRSAAAKFAAGDLSGGALLVGQTGGAQKFAADATAYGMTACAGGID